MLYCLQNTLSFVFFERVISVSDFMLWLHANYIRPQLETVPPGDYSAYFDLVKNELTPSFQEDLEKCLEFTAIHAFALGFRTGKGLARLTPQ